MTKTWWRQMMGLRLRRTHTLMMSRSKTDWMEYIIILSSPKMALTSLHYLSFF
jgi:hypothetical protein